jgi:hypothetical protein
MHKLNLQTAFPRSKVGVIAEAVFKILFVNAFVVMKKNTCRKTIYKQDL